MLTAKNACTERHATYVALTGLFVALLGAFSLFQHRKGKPDEFKALDLAMLGLATFRLGRLVAYDKVFETERLAFTQTVPHESGAGDTVVAAGTGARQAIGELIACPICAGTWISAVLIYALGVVPGPARIFLRVMAAMGLVEVINAGNEALQWTGEAARIRAGSSQH